MIVNLTLLRDQNGEHKRDDRKGKITKQNKSSHNIFQHKQCQSNVYVLLDSLPKEKHIRSRSPGNALKSVRKDLLMAVTPFGVLHRFISIKKVSNLQL